MKMIPGIMAVYLLAGSSLHATTIVENFNYGLTTSALGGFGLAQDGWAGAWTSESRPTYTQNYTASPSLSFSSPYYSNGGNEATGVLSGQNIGILQNRTLVDANGLKGTVWVSALFKTTGTGSAILYLNAANYTGMSMSATTMQGRLGGSTWANGATLSVNTTYLMLMRLMVDVDETGNDAIDFWVFDNDDASAIPPLSSSSAGLVDVMPAMSISGRNMSQNISIGSSLTKIGVSTSGAAMLDAIRISNDVDGYSQVISSVPEAASLSLLGLGTLALLRRKS